MSAEHLKPTAAPDTQKGSAKQESSRHIAIARDEKRTQPPLRLRWNRWDWLYVGILLALVVGMAARFTPNMTGEIPGYWWDPLLNTWTLAWDTTALAHHPLQLWQAPLLYPNNLTLSYSENLLGNIIYFAPVFLITRNPVLAYNVTFYMIFLLCGLNMYIVARSYTRRRFAAFVAALIYAFAPYRMAQIDHIPVTGGEWIPLALLFLDKSFQYGKWRDWILFALFYLLQLLSSVYLGIFLTYTLLAYVLIRYTAVFWRQWRLSGPAYIARLAKLAVKPVIVLGVTAAVIVALMYPYLVSLRNGYARSVVQTEGYSATFKDFTHTTPFNLLYGFLSIHGQYLRPDGEHFLFLGFSTMMLAAAGVVLAFLHRNTTVRAYAWTGLIVLLFAFGPYIRLTARSSIPMPWLIAFNVLPGFKGLRVPSRLIDVLLMMLAVLGAYAIAHIQDRLDTLLASNGADTQKLARPRASTLRRQPIIAGLLLVIPLALLLEAMPAYLPVTQAPSGTAIPPVYQWLATHGGAQPIIELPMSNDHGIPDQYESWYDYYTIFHPHPIVNGWSGYRPPNTTAISNAMLTFPDAASISMLQRYHIIYVVVHPQLFSVADSPGAIADMLRQMQGNMNLRLVQVFGGSMYTSDSVWQVV